MVDAIGRAGNINDFNYTNAITPDAMLMYCQSRLKDIDDQMQSQFEKQKQYRAGTAAVNDLITIFNEPANTAQGIDGRAGANGVDPHTYQVKADAAFDKAINSLPPGPERTQVEQARDRFHAGFNDRTGQNSGDTDVPYVYTAGECKAIVDSLTNVSKSMSSSAELDMMNLNSLMSQRQMAVQMCTNMISALGETQKSIAAKMG